MNSENYLLLLFKNNKTLEPDPYSLLLQIQTFSSLLEEVSIFGLLLFILTVLTALFASYEVAFFSLSPENIESLRERDDFRAKIILTHHQNNQVFLASILIGINVLNILIVLVSGMMLHEIGLFFKLSPLVISILEISVISSFLIIFAEISPKVYASHRYWSVALSLAPLIHFFYRLFYPLGYLLASTANFFEKKPDSNQNLITAEELKHAIDLTSDDTSPKEEKEILKSLVNFSQIQTRAIMTARVNMKSISYDCNPAKLMEYINDFGYSRIPVYDQDLDHIKGVLYVKDLLPLLKENDFSNWQNLIRPVFFVPEFKRINKLLAEFQQKRLHIAIVVDEFGGTAGLVTLEDIMEQIFGEISEEYDTEDPGFVRVSDSIYYIDGKVPILDFLRITELPETVFDTLELEAAAADSIGGLLIEMQGKLPQQGEVIVHSVFTFTIEALSSHSIKKIKVEIARESLQEN